MRLRPLLTTSFVCAALWVADVHALASPCNGGTVFEDRNGNAHQDSGERGLAGVRVSDGERIVVTDTEGSYRLPVESGRTIFVIKPAGHAFAKRADGLPDFWRHVQTEPGPSLKYGGIPVEVPGCRDFALQPDQPRTEVLDVLVFGDPQPKSMADVDYFRRDIVEPLVGRHGAQLGLSLGDIVNDDLALYPAMNAVTAQLAVPWLHVAGNHDLDLDAASDADSLRTFRNHFGPDTFAWEEDEATFVVLDDVVYRPGQKPAYVGGLREEQFAFLEAYLPTLPKDRLLVLAVHVPFFNVAPPGKPETFRVEDRERLFALLRAFPHVLLLSAHSHNQRHVLHDATSGWHGAKPLHEYNVGAACGAFWSGAKDANGIPDSAMSDGTPNGYASLKVKRGGEYALAWHPARDADATIGLHAPKVLRRDAYPAWGVYANVFMGRDDSRVEYRIDDGDWKPMVKVAQPDPRLLVENMRDDLTDTLRGYDRSPEAIPSQHLWRGALPTDLDLGEHRIEVRVFDAWRGELRAHARYRLAAATE
ncbi:calcineurin-like phosphoesterase C-terminal domain-containing protein [Lysobacter sp. CFH 32150]|uniref:calcineurin-like phosphoesterase C-terminal domain-containing protein n=1 Tax=Lysobacter sp. CFH 32150 TaxID=2927128 RepID=UPI001FA746E0|nr:calcineurin-like phosphoesterase C-terminal domain-containing protein [Lysobacter sp. CFH 32150]MCI4567314.1 calcineurin-like phosphoesterase C-terminal domain-containing protein [Lysobacter sp. CFH 32150]